MTSNKSWSKETQGYIGICEACGKNVFGSYIQEGDKVYHKTCYLKSKGLIKSKKCNEKESINDKRL